MFEGGFESHLPPQSKHLASIPYILYSQSTLWQSPARSIVSGPAQPVGREPGPQKPARLFLDRRNRERTIASKHSHLRLKVESIKQGSCTNGEGCLDRG